MYLQLNLKIILPSLFALIILGIIFRGNLKPNNLEKSLDIMALSSYIDQGILKCRESGEDLLANQQCYKNFAREISDSASFSEILTAFEKGNSLESCHDAMHHIVNNQYRKGATLPEIYEQCTSACYGACYHGGLEGYFESENLRGASDEILEGEMMKVCGQISSRKRSQCYHGLGHAVMFLKDGDLIKSLKLCDIMSPVNGNKTCYEGVFMENLPNNTSGHPVKFIDESNPLYPCNILDEKYVETCYEFQVSLFNYFAKNDIAKVAEYCKEVPTAYRNMCFRRIGSSSFGRVSEISRLKDICDYVPATEARRHCLVGVVDSFFDRYSEDEIKLLHMMDYCLTLKENFLADCYGRAIEVLSQVFTPESELYINGCYKIPSIKYREQCLSYKKADL